MDTLNENTRTLLNDIDTKVSILLEELEDNYNIYDEDNYELGELKENLETIKSQITGIQEEQGWLD